MRNHSSAFLGRYFKMDSTIDFVPNTPLVLHSQHLSYYVAIGVVLFAAWIFQSSQSSKQSQVDAPFYKASILKWYFDAETLVLDSYNKASTSWQIVETHMLTSQQFYDRVYQIKATEGVQVIIPSRLIGELKSLPETVLSATEAVSEVSCPQLIHLNSWLVRS